ncbi:transposase [Micromonospora sp. NPDC006766]|uniref:transposase n=1 Tax=Micromonospora sp. NPDC006766 TaxID=3154778 RepID=UPI0033EED482
MDEGGLARVRVRLEEFAAGVFAGLPRSDQRATGLRYLRGLMLDGRRKSMQPLAERLGVDHQQLQQFLTSSTWDVTHLVRLQARSALADFTTGDQHAAAADRLAERHDRLLVGVFTQWYRALRLAATGPSPQAAEAAYRDAAAQLANASMPGVERGLLPLALLCQRVWHGDPIRFDNDSDWGPYTPWVRPLVLLTQDRPADAAAALRQAPDPPRDLLFEALWCPTAQAAIALDNRTAMKRARTELTPAANELAGAGSGMLTVGPVSRYLDHLTAALSRTR